MERAYDLQPHEMQQQQALEQEHRQLMAQFGAMTYQLEQVRARIPQIEERQRTLANQVIARHGVTNFLNARIIGNHLVCTLPDEPLAMPMMDVPESSVRTMRLNGPETTAKE